MTKLLKAAQAGSVESTDILIMVAPAETGAGIKVELVSPTMQQYGEQIKTVIINTLRSHGIEDAVVHANDKGALNFAIEARVTTAISRALS
ncbi:citrate lyase acyl carrier protein [Sporomusa malonica]|uniref:Citrate lyase subunit gamma (Acyl carrier protein) n=1 Tax=Sporomusa malonica TaxID=112901 RepID=A0A1W2C1A7_9FIRM|nr:citrate lyase acyl carrier protein [Sporomusa malonica]SMC78963.1 citrate lyase subunit gamma (acyl carrier protein) [Sporomusa malonica]